MSTALMTVEEVTESLTGFEEIAIEKHMGIDIYTDGETKPIMALRALVFVMRTREGLTTPDAKKAAMEMAMGEVSECFAEDDEVDLEEPVTEPGKDDEQPESGPTT